MEKETFTSIEKCLLILDSLSMAPYEFKVQDISGKIGFNRSSVYRILRTLEKYELVVCDNNTNKFKVGPGMYHLGTTYLNANNYKSQIQYILDEIASIVKESVGIAIKDGDKIMSLFEVEIHQPNKLNDMPGRYFYGNRGCYGKCIIAYQSDSYINYYLKNHSFEKLTSDVLVDRDELWMEYRKIRKDGYVISINETGMDTVGVGIPLFSKEGNIKACVAVAFYQDDNYLEKLDSIKTVLFQYKEKLELFLP